MFTHGLPFWATRLYKAAPLKHIIKVGYSDPGGRLHQPCEVVLECGHRKLAEVRVRFEVPDKDDVPRERWTCYMREEELRERLPRQRCHECQEEAYPELGSFGYGGFMDEECYNYKSNTARIEAHERGEKVPPKNP